LSQKSAFVHTVALFANHFLEAILGSGQELDLGWQQKDEAASMCGGAAGGRRRDVSAPGARWCAGQRRGLVQVCQGVYTATGGNIHNHSMCQDTIPKLLSSMYTHVLFIFYSACS